jgi:hypothetical protein
MISSISHHTGRRSCHVFAVQQREQENTGSPDSSSGAHYHDRLLASFFRVFKRAAASDQRQWQLRLYLVRCRAPVVNHVNTLLISLLLLLLPLPPPPPPPCPWFLAWPWSTSALRVPRFGRRGSSQSLRRTLSFRSLQFLTS